MFNEFKTIDRDVNYFKLQDYYKIIIDNYNSIDDNEIKLFLKFIKENIQRDFLNYVYIQSMIYNQFKNGRTVEFMYKLFLNSGLTFSTEKNEYNFKNNILACLIDDIL